MSFFSDLADAIRNAFSGGSAGGAAAGGGGGPSRSMRPQTRPSIMSVERDGQMQRVATRDMPRFGITAGQRTTDPEFGTFSLEALTSRDPANVMRNIQGAERAARMGAGMGGGGEDRPEVAKDMRPAEPAAPEIETGEAKGARPVEEGTGESAAARARRLGLASTIATTPGGLLADESATRRRRSLMGGGLIA
jgi:hypothetical protein